MRTRNVTYTASTALSLLLVACSAAPDGGAALATSPLSEPPKTTTADGTLEAKPGAPLPALDPAARFADAESTLDVKTETGSLRAVTLLTSKIGPSTFAHRVLTGEALDFAGTIEVEHLSPTHVVMRSGDTVFDKELDAPVTPAQVASVLLLAGTLQPTAGVAARPRRTLGGADCYGHDMTCSVPDVLRKILNGVLAPTLSRMLDNHTFSFPCPTLFDWSKRGIANIEECCQDHDRRLYCGAETLIGINAEFGACVTKKVWDACDVGMNKPLAPVLGTLFALGVQGLTMFGAGDYEEAQARKEQRKASCLCGGSMPTEYCWATPCKATTCSTARAKKYPQPSDFTAACTPPPPHDEGAGPVIAAPTPGVL